MSLRDVRDAVTQQCSNMEKLLGKKMAKQAYADADVQLVKKREESLTKCRSIVALL